MILDGAIKIIFIFLHHIYIMIYFLFLYSLIIEYAYTIQSLLLLYNKPFIVYFGSFLSDSLH